MISLNYLFYELLYNLSELLLFQVM